MMTTSARALDLMEFYRKLAEAGKLWGNPRNLENGRMRFIIIQDAGWEHSAVTAVAEIVTGTRLDVEQPDYIDEAARLLHLDVAALVMIDNAFGCVRGYNRPLRGELIASGNQRVPARVQARL